MKKDFLILLILVLTSTFSLSQDIITTKKGEDILAKISESTKTEIRYKLFDHQEGPAYTILKSDILMIRYENGTKEIFSDESKSNAGPFRANVPTQTQPDQKLFFAGKSEKYKRMKNTGASLTLFGASLIIAGIITSSNSSSTTNNYGTTSATGNTGAGTAALIGISALGAGIPLWIIGGHSRRKYERKLQGLSFRLNASPHTTGLTLSFRFNHYRIPQQ